MVLVSHTHKFIYLKTIKTASTSVEMYLEPHCLPPDHGPLQEARRHTRSRYGIVGMRGRRPKNPLLRLLHPWWHHMPAAKVKRKLGAARWRTYRKVAIFRNPYDRTLSFYIWKHGIRAPSTPDELGDFLPGFRDHVLSIKPPDDHRIVHVGDQFVIDEVVYFERLIPDLEQLSIRLGIPWQPDRLPHTKTRRTDRSIPLSAYFTREMRERVRAHSAWIFDRHGYSDDPDQPLPNPTLEPEPAS